MITSELKQIREEINDIHWILVCFTIWNAVLGFVILLR